MPTKLSRRQILHLGSLSVLTGLSGCASSLVGTIGFRLRNYTSTAYNARIKIQFYGRVMFEQTYQLPAASSADPYIHIEEKAVSNIPSGVSYSVILFLNGSEERTINATMDCMERETQPMDEEIDINIGFGEDDEIQMADSSC